MDCHRIKEFLQENFLATGYDFPAEVMEHLDGCPDCRAYYEELVSLGEKLDPISEISMTPEESMRFESELMPALEAVDPAPTSYVAEGRIFSIARLALAAAAVLVMMVVSNNPDISSGLAILQNVDELQLSQVDDEDMALLFSNGDSDFIPSLFEEESATYITNQLQPGQADNILETISPEELEWLMENLTLEI